MRESDKGRKFKFRK